MRKFKTNETNINDSLLCFKTNQQIKNQLEKEPTPVYVLM